MGQPPLDIGQHFDKLIINFQLEEAPALFVMKSLFHLARCLVRIVVGGEHRGQLLGIRQHPGGKEGLLGKVLWLLIRVQSLNVN